jgi:hypothetical protein
MTSMSDLIQPFAGADSRTNNKQPLGIPIPVMQVPKTRNRPIDNLSVAGTENMLSKLTNIDLRESPSAASPSLVRQEMQRGRSGMADVLSPDGNRNRLVLENNSARRDSM